MQLIGGTSKDARISRDIRQNGAASPSWRYLEMAYDWSNAIWGFTEGQTGVRGQPKSQPSTKLLSAVSCLQLASASTCMAQTPRPITAVCQPPKQWHVCNSMIGCRAYAFAAVHISRMKFINAFVMPSAAELFTHQLPQPVTRQHITKAAVYGCTCSVVSNTALLHTAQEGHPNTH